MERTPILKTDIMAVLKVARKKLNRVYAGWCPTCRKEVQILPKSEIEERKGMTSKSAKQKARRAQQAVAQIIRDAFCLADEDVESIAMGQCGQDLRLTEAARRAWPLHAIEITAKLNLSLFGKFRQAQEHAKKQSTGKTAGNGRPVLIFKRNGTDFFAMLTLEDLIAVIKEARGAK